MPHGCRYLWINQETFIGIYRQLLIWKMVCCEKWFALNRGGSWYPTPLTGWMTWLDQDNKTEEDHLKHWKVAALLLYNAQSSLNVWKYDMWPVINLRYTPKKVCQHFKKKKKKKKKKLFVNSPVSLFDFQINLFQMYFQVQRKICYIFLIFYPVPQ